MEVLCEALSLVHLSTEQFSVQQVDFDQVVGETTCVATSDTDEIVFAQRPCRRGLTRFVLKRQPDPATSVVVILKRIEEGNYLLITAWIGKKSEPEPWDKNATENSVKFWSSHALVWGSEEIIKGTETTVSPW